MNYQLSQIEKNNIELSFSSSNYMDLENFTSSAIKKGCNDIFVYTLQAIACAKQRKFSIAEDWFLKVIKIEPTDFSNKITIVNAVLKELESFRQQMELNKIFTLLDLH